MSDAAAKDGLRLPSADSMRVMLSRWENTHVVPDETYQRYLCAALHADEGQLGFVHSDDVALTLGVTRAPESTAHLLGHLTRTLDELASADNALGSATVLAAAESEAKMATTLVRHTSGPHRTEFLVLASRFAEFCGWLRQDAGDLERARRWSDLALELAQECGDASQLSYVLMRKSNLSLESGETPSAVGLAEAALRHGDEINPQLRAVAHRAQALGQAMSGEERGCLVALEQARAEIEMVEVPDDRAAYVSVAYVESEAGRCLVSLKQPQRAQHLLVNALDAWPTSMERDRAHCMTRLSSALDLLGDADGSAEMLIGAANVAGRMSSQRLRQEIRSVAHGLARRGRLGSLAKVSDAILGMS